MGTHVNDLIGSYAHTFPVPATVATAGDGKDAPMFRAPRDITVTAVRFIPETAITGHATNYATVGIVNNGLAGTGTTSVASKAFDTPTTDDVAANDETAITLSGTAANLDVDEGEVLNLDVDKAGTGMVVDGIVVLEYQAR